MPDNDVVAKLEAWVESHPESADTPFMNVTTGQEFTVRSLLNHLRQREAGEAVLDESVLAELSQVEEWIRSI